MNNRPQNEIDEVMNWASEGVDAGSKYPGMSYEEGIRDAIDWITGLTDDRPDGK